MTLYECITCGDLVNTVEGFNCQKCSTATGNATATNGSSAPEGTILIIHLKDSSPENAKENARLLANALNSSLTWRRCGNDEETNTLSRAFGILCNVAGTGYVR